MTDGYNKRLPYSKKIFFSSVPPMCGFSILVTDS